MSKATKDLSDETLCFTQGKCAFMLKSIIGHIYMNKLLSLKDAAECLAISPKKLERLVKKGKLPAYKIGGSYLRFKKEDIESFKETAYGNIGFAVSNKKKGHLHIKYIFFDAIKDFFYFNSFYIIAVIIAIIMVFFILRF